MTSERSPEPWQARVVDDGVLLSWQLVQLLGSGRFRRMVQRQFHVDGGLIHPAFAQLVDTIDVAARGASVRFARDTCSVARTSVDEYRNKPTVDVAEASRLLGIGRPGVLRRIERGKLDAWKDDDDRWRIPVEQLR